MATQQDIIKKFMKFLDETTELSGEAAIDAAFKAASADSRQKFNTMQEVADAFLIDYENAESVDQFLREKCGIILDNEDTGSITGLDVGGTKIKTDENIVPENTSPTDLVELYRNADIPDTPTEEILLAPLKDPNLKIVPRAIVSSTFSVVEDLRFTKKGLTVTVPNYNWIIEADESGDNEASRKLIVINGLYSWWIEKSLELIEESYGENFGFTNESSAVTKEITVNLDEISTDDTICGTQFKNGKLYLYVYMNKFPDITQDDTEGKYGSDRLDHTIAHEMTHAVMDVNISDISGVESVYDLGQLVSEGMAELTRGIDIYRKNSIISTLELPKIVIEILNAPYKTSYYSEGSYKTGQYCIGYMLMRYFAKQCADESPVSDGTYSMTLTSNADHIVTAEGNATTNVITKNGKFSGKVIGSAVVKQDEIRVHKNPLNVTGTAHDFSFIGGDNDDNVSVKGDNITVDAKTGNNSVYLESNNTTVNCSGNYDTVTVIGNNAHIEAHGHIYFKGTEATIRHIGRGNDSITVDGSKANVSVDDGINELAINGNENTVTGGSGKDSITVNGSNNLISPDDSADEISISAGALNNTIKGFEDGTDSLYLSAKTLAGRKENVIFNGEETEAVIITSPETNETLAVLIDITEGVTASGRIFYNDGKNQTSISYLLEGGTIESTIPPEINPKIISGTNGDDEIDNYSDNVIINALAGNDRIYNSGDSVSIDGGTGDDSIENHGESVIINTGDGSDSIYNRDENITINSDEGNDTINNSSYGKNVIIHAGIGDDEISNVASNVTIGGGAGNDTITGGGYVSFSNPGYIGGGPTRYYYYISSNMDISGGAGNDSIHLTGIENALIDAGEGDDTVSVGSYYSTVYRNTSYVPADHITVVGGKGNDSIKINGENNLFKYNDGDGNDTIDGFNETDTLQIGDGTNNYSMEGSGIYSYGKSGSDIIIKLGNGSIVITDAMSLDTPNIPKLDSLNITCSENPDSIENHFTYATIQALDGNDSIENSGSNVSINSGAGVDTVINFGDNVTITSGNDGDSIRNEGKNIIIETNGGDDTIDNNDENVSINGGAGNDSVISFGNFVSISGGDGNDSIENYHGQYVTINGGVGDDYLDNHTWYSMNVFFEYNLGDGKDTITAFKADDTLKISGSSYSTQASDNDIVIIVGNGSIILNDAASLETVNIVGTLSSDNSTDTTSADTTPADTTPADTTPADTTPADTTPADTTPADTTPADTTPADTTSADTTPADTTPADTTPADTTPADTTPADTTPADTTPADTTPADTTPSGQDQSSTIQIIKETTGIDVSRLDSIVLTDSDSIEEVISGGSKLLNISSDSGVMDVDLRDSDYRQIVSLGGGNQIVQFNDENGNVAIVDASATGSKNIIFGNGDDLGIFYSSDANIRATVGSGRDSIITDNNAHVRVDMNSSEGTRIIPYSGRIILDNYDPDSRAEIIIPDVTDITSAIKDNSIQLIGNEVRPNSSTRIQLNGSTNANIVNLSTEHGDTQKVGFTGINGGAVDAHELRGNFLLKGNYAENASDKQKRKPSTLISGNGHDTILAGARDFVDGGNGRNQIFLTPYDLRQIRDGATIASSGNGRNTIHGFHEGFGYDGDVIQVKDFNNLKFKFDTDGLLLTANDSRIKFDGIDITSATTDDSTNSLGTNRAELIQITNGSSTMRTAVAQTNQSILVQEDDYITPNAFFGNRSGLNFSEYNGNVEINLTDGTGKLGNWNATFRGINKLQAGDGMSTLIGDDTRNTLIAGTGYTSMWGGAGNDKLIGKGNSTDKDGRTTFFFFAGDGRDVISDFTFLTPENRYDGIDDRINVGDSDINDAYRAGNNVVVVFDQNSYLILEDAVGKDFQIANMIAKVDRNIAYDGLANCYVASGGSSLTVDSTVRSAEIWLDNSHGTQFFGNIRTLDASAVEGNTSLVGNEFDDTIIAGQGDSSLWGGFSPSNDLLIGGSSRNTFFYCMGNGNDTIQGINDKDFIILSDVSLDQIIETSITADSVSIRFNDGGSLQIQGTSDVTYQLADGSRYSANHEHLEWDSR